MGYVSGLCGIRLNLQFTLFLSSLIHCLHFHNIAQSRTNWQQDFPLFYVSLSDFFLFLSLSWIHSFGVSFWETFERRCCPSVLCRAQWPDSEEKVTIIKDKGTNVTAPQSSKSGRKLRKTYTSKARNSDVETRHSRVSHLSIIKDLKYWFIYFIDN